MELLGNRPAADGTNSRGNSRVEQVAALEALATIDGPDAAQAVTRLLLCNVIQGPGLKIAVAAAEIQPAGKDRVRATPTSRSGDAGRGLPLRATLEIVALLVDLLDDLPEPVAMEAAVALARMSRQESPTAASGLIRTAPDSRWDRPFACQGYS